MKLLRLLFPPATLLLALLVPGNSQTTTKTPATKKSAPAKRAMTKSAPVKSAAGAPAKGSTKKRSTRARAIPRPVTQQLPEGERTREIQEALTAKGYPVDATGVWGPQSMEALKKFQEDQHIKNMSGRGKLDSLTLIALGLGPRREPPPASGGPVEQAPMEGRQQK